MNEQPGPHATHSSTIDAGPPLTFAPGDQDPRSPTSQPLTSRLDAAASPQRESASVPAGARDPPGTPRKETKAASGGGRPAGAGAVTLSLGEANQDMRGRSMASPILGSGLGTGFGVGAGSSANLRSLQSKLPSALTSLERLLRQWFSFCRPLPPLTPLLLFFFLLLLLLAGPALALFALVSSTLAPQSNDSLLPSSRTAYPLPHLSNLVMVAGHSVYTSTHCDAYDAEKSWYLEPYQRLPGAAKTFLDHIRLGVRVASGDPKALLLFSGGQTRPNGGPRSEGQSYWFVAEGNGWFGKQEVAARTLAEEYARDSFENILFSVCRFRELTGTYPQNITVVSYNFKQDRFMNVHRAALRFPADRYFFLGTPMVAEGEEGAAKGEAATLETFKHDPYGCRGVLKEKRLKRDPFARTIPYPLACPELASLFRYCGTHHFRGRLPWDTWRHPRKSGEGR